jgi:hypothetical protein
MFIYLLMMILYWLLLSTVSSFETLNPANFERECKFISLDGKWLAGDDALYAAPSTQTGSDYVGALLACSALSPQATLAMPKTLNDRTIVDYIITALLYNGLKARIGATQFPLTYEPDGNWKWADGNPFDMNLWANKQPDNENGTEHCACMMGAGQYKIFDCDCTSTQFAPICALSCKIQILFIVID